MTGPDGAPVAVSLSADGSFTAPDTRQATLQQVRAVLVGLPDLDAEWPWSVRVDLPAAGPVRICAAG